MRTMSSPVLARKYRPREFDALVGQEHVVQALTNALEQRRLHHAYLFTGTRGVGKTTVSRILAKSLNCVGADGGGNVTSRPCGVCAACNDIDAGRFVDYVELDAASNRGVDEIGQLLAQAVYKPVLGRFKVYMIDEVHMLSNTAFNAMLKTLEEPPDYLKFVLATTDPQKVPATVLSRCLQFNLRPMAPSTIAQHLALVLGQEKIEAEPGALRLLARAARGSMRDALSLTDQAIAYGAGRLGEEDVRRMLGAVDRGHAVRIVEAIAARDGAAVVRSVDELRGLGLSGSGALEELCELLQRMAVVQAVPDALEADEPGADDVRRLAERLPADETQLFYSIVLHGRGDLAVSPDEYSGLVMVLLRMIAFAPADAAERPRAPVPSRPTAAATAPTAAAASTGTGAREAALAAASSATAALRVPARPASATVFEEPEVAYRLPPQPDATQRPAASNPTAHRPLAASAATQPPAALAPAPQQSTTWSAEPGERWHTLARQMIDAGAISALVRELAMQAQCVFIDDAAQPALFRLRVARENLRTESQLDKLQSALAECLKREVRIEAEAGIAQDSPALREQAERDRIQAEAEQLIANDPLVLSLLSQYKGARIVPGSIKPN
jgi:DNA polymerase III subunit gamma/tau